MPVDPLRREYSVIRRRPKAVTEWADLNDLLADDCDEILGAVGSDWQMEGPLFEADELYVHAWRAAASATGKPIELSIEIGIEATPEPSPPERIRVSLRAEESPSQGSELAKPGILEQAKTGALWILCAVAGFLVWRGGHGAFLAALAILATRIGLFIVMRKLEAWQHRNDPPPIPSSEFLEVVAALETYLRGPRSPFGDIEEIAPR